MTGPHQTELEGELRGALRRLAEDTAPPPGADVGQAVARGRRTIRTRRALRVAAPLAAAALVASGVALALPDDEERVVSSSPSPHRWSAPVSFGWLPWESTVTMQSFSDDAFNEEYSIAVRSPEPEGEIVSLAFARITPEEWKRKGFLDAVGVSVLDPVQGRKAYWDHFGSKETHPERGRLVFEYEKDRWVRVSLGRTKGRRTHEEIVGVVRRIAENLRFAPRPVALPFRLSGLPSELAWQRANVLWHHVPDRRRVTLTFAHGLLIRLKPAGDADREPPNTTVAGHPAYRFVGTGTRWKAGWDEDKKKPGPAEQIKERRSKMAGSETLCVYNIRTFDVCMYTEAQIPGGLDKDVKDVEPGPDWASEVLRPSGGLVGLFERMTLIDGPVSGWSTAPFQE